MVGHMQPDSAEADLGLHGPNFTADFKFALDRDGEHVVQGRSREHFSVTTIVVVDVVPSFISFAHQRGLRRVFTMANVLGTPQPGHEREFAKGGQM